MIIKYGGTDITELILEYKRKGSVNDADAFLLGNTPANQIDLKIDNSSKILQTLSGDIQEFDDKGVLKGTYQIIEAPERYTDTVKLTCFDHMLKTNIAYDSKIVYPNTIMGQLDEIATITGMTIDYHDLPSAVLNQEINWWDNTISCRDYLGWVAEIAGTNAMVDPAGKLIFKELPTTVTWTTDDVDDYEHDDLYTVSRVCFDNGLVKFEQGDGTGNTLYLSANNPYIDTTHDPTSYIYNRYKGMSYRPLIKMRVGGIDDIALFDVISYQGNKYLCLDYTSTYKGGSYQIQDIKSALPTVNTEKSTVKYDDMVKVRKLEIAVDNNKQTLDIVAQDIEGANKKLSQITQTVEGITEIVTSTDTRVEIIENTKRYHMDIASSGGTAFRNGEVSTTLSVSCFSWDSDITAVVSDAAVRWSRISADADGDASWSRTGKSTVITSTDFVDCATFIAAWNGIEQRISLVNVNDGESGTPGKDGKDGRTTYFHVKYAPVANPTDEQMVETPDKYIGTYVDYLPEDSTVAQRYTWSKFTGDDGIPGQNGENGQTSYLHIRYSDDGGKTFTKNNGKDPGYYLGQYTDFTQADSTDPGRYTWVMVKGDKGDDSILLHISSSNGYMFKNSTISTTLVVNIIVGGDTIDNSMLMYERFGDTAQLQWKYKLAGQDDYTLMPQDDPRLSDNGFILTLDNKDVYMKTTFTCDLII